MKPDLTPYLGKRVLLVIDRPLGSRHPEHPDLVYPLNYGYVPGTVSGDGRPIDGYLLGVDKPVAEADAVVIAVVERSDDVEDKLVAAPQGSRFPAVEIARLVAFQEQYFTSRVIMEPKSKT